MPTPTLHYTRATPASPLQKAAADRFDIDLTDPLRHNPAAVPSSHPSSPAANPPLFSDPKVAQALLVDYVAGLTASRLCSNYNISLPQLFAWRRSPETQAMLAEHEEFAAAQTRQVQHDKEPEIILTLCAIATRGSSESESRRAASDLLRAFKFRDYLAQRATANSRPCNLVAQSDNQTPDTRSDSSVPSDPSALSIPRSATPRPPRAYTPPIPSLPRRGDSPNQSPAQCSSRATCPPHFPKGLVPQTASRAMLATTPDASQPERLPESSRGSPRPAAHPRCTLAELPHAESVQPSALDRQAQISELDHLAAHDNTRAQSSDEIEDQALDLDDEERLEAELEQDQADEAEDDDHDDDQDTDDEDNEVDDDPVDTQENHKTPQSPVNSNTSSDPSVPSASRSALRTPNSALPDARCLIPDASPLEQQILTLPAEVPSFSPKKPDPVPGFPFCLVPKPSGTAPSFEEMARFMPPPSKSFNPFWPESDILYLCYPGRTDKHNLRSAIISHQEALARSGAQALVDRNHFPPDQQSHQAYVAAEDFYKQLARKTPPPDH